MPTELVYGAVRAAESPSVRHQQAVGAFYLALVLEVLSPHPRIGKLEERISWFVEYGVQEVWLLHQTSERFEILRTRDRRLIARDTFDYLEPIRSEVLPAFRMTVDGILHPNPDLAG